VRKSFLNLLRHTASQISDELIARYTPVDPGYPSYVKHLKAVRNTLEVPYPVDFDLHEPINLAAWGKPEAYDSPEEFRRFRRFTSSIALHPMEMDAKSGIAPLGEFHGSHFLAHDLLVDATVDQPAHLTLLMDAIKSARTVLTSPIKESLPDFEFIDTHCVCFSFGLIYLSQLANDWKSSEHFATQLILDVHEGNLGNGPMIDYPTPDIFWHDQSAGNWKRLIDSLQNPTNHPDLAVVIKALESSG